MALQALRKQLARSRQRLLDASAAEKATVSHHTSAGKDRAALAARNELLDYLAERYVALLRSYRKGVEERFLE